MKQWCALYVFLYSYINFNDAKFWNLLLSKIYGLTAIYPD